MCARLQVAVRNNQQGVLYFSSPFKPEVLAAQSNASSTDFFVSLLAIISDSMNDRMSYNKFQLDSHDALPSATCKPL